VGSDGGRRQVDDAAPNLAVLFEVVAGAHAVIPVGDHQCPVGVDVTTNKQYRGQGDPFVDSPHILRNF
jgi:hypothetical protein